ncbi:hypothetical protein [Baaleninema simplex]|uniref:hypothetical protein n=1 Tax=Baaleninema simplex TaxID=2862350 RepID=UPI00034704DA|nr:hypothetical protein [Baaleninema simplex]
MTKRYRAIAIGVACLVFLFAGFARGATGNVDAETCTANGFSLFGKVRVVESFPDLTVKIVDAFPDLNVQVVDAFPDRCGQWEFVESFPDIEIKFVESFPDIEIKFVDAFPGIP